MSKREQKKLKKACNYVGADIALYDADRIVFLKQLDKIQNPSDNNNDQ